MIGTIVMFLYLSVLSVSDLKSRKIPGLLLRIGLLFSFLYVSAMIFVFGPSAEMLIRVMTALAGALPGLALAILSGYSDKIGRGDGMVLMMIGITESCTFSMILMSAACVILALFSGVLMAFHKVSSKTKMPYIPFVAGTYLFMKIFERGIWI